MTMISTALDEVTPTLRDVAEWMHLNYHTVRSWRLGRRIPTPKVQQQLARTLRQQGNRVIKAADRLERAAKREQKGQP